MVITLFLGVDIFMIFTHVMGRIFTQPGDSDTAVDSKMHLIIVVGRIFVVFALPLIPLYLGIKGILPGTRDKKPSAAKPALPPSPPPPPIPKNTKSPGPLNLKIEPRQVHQSFSHESIPDFFIQGEDRDQYISGLFRSKELLERIRQGWRLVATAFGEDPALADQLNLTTFKNDPYVCGFWEFPPAREVGEASLGLLVVGPLGEIASVNWKTVPVRYFIAERDTGPIPRLLEWSPKGYQLLGPGPRPGDPMTVFTNMVFDRIMGKQRPSAQQAAKRLLILKHIGIYIQTIPLGQKLYASPEVKPEAKADMHSIFGGMFIKKFHDENLWDDVSPKERKLLETEVKDVTQQQLVIASWRFEATQVLMWALGLLPSLPLYDSQARYEEFSIANPAEFMASAKLRDEKEINQARKVAELWHWRSRTRELQEEGKPCPLPDWMKSAGINSYEDLIKGTVQMAEQDGSVPKNIGDDFPACGKAYRDLDQAEWSVVRSITAERHFALNWLCGYSPGNAWDNTPTDT